MAGFRVPHADSCVCAPCCKRRAVLLQLAIAEEKAGRGEVFRLPYGRPPYARPGTEETLKWRYSRDEQRRMRRAAREAKR